MGATEPAKPIGGTAIKPPGWDRKGLEAFKYFLYNPDTGEVLSRTPLSWAKITAFYIVYYSCLAAFWIACLQIFFLTLPEGRPKWEAGSSLIGMDPGVGMQPHTSDKNIASSLFILDTKDVKTIPTNKWGIKGEGELMIDVSTRLDMFMATYKNDTFHNKADYDNCKANNGLDSVTELLRDISALNATIEEGLVNNRKEEGLMEERDRLQKTLNNMYCKYDPAVHLGDCANSPYGFKSVDGTINPCFFIKLNKIFGFKPQGISKADLDSDDQMKLDERVYKEMPDDIRNAITDDSADKVYFDCQGRFPADREGMKLEFFPAHKSISISKHFPYMGGNYQSPLLAVKVIPEIKDQLLHIECRVWYRDVQHVSKDKSGLTQFEVMIQ